VICITDFFLFLPLQVLCQRGRAGSAGLARLLHDKILRPVCQGGPM
jgi:hypothetical protein